MNDSDANLLKRIQFKTSTITAQHNAMQDIEPYFNWRHLYTAEEDEHSLFYEREYSEFEYSNTVYNYYIHPQWDEFGSRTLYLKQLYADYEKDFVILELLGEWNDAVENDIMTLKREVIDLLLAKGVRKFLLITENVLNFHSGDSDYYEEWQEEVSERGGWIAFINTPKQTLHDFRHSPMKHYIHFLETPSWRTWLPEHFYEVVDNAMIKLLD